MKSILGIPNSILAHFGAVPHHTTLPILDEKLKRGWKNVVLLIFDGLGTDVLQAHAPNGFLWRHRIGDLASVNPYTTTSALTTLETGLSPMEHEWLGWSCYFREIDECVDLFSGKYSGTERQAADYPVVWENIGFKHLFAQIRDANPTMDCCYVSPFSKPAASTCEEVCARIAALCAGEGRRYIYAYHFRPDYDMHEHGCYDARVKDSVQSFDRQVERLSGELTDTLLIVTADHGMHDVKMLCVEDYPEIAECLRVPPSREPRNLSFFVKEEYMDIFPERWNARFSDSFHLMTGDEAFARGIFGDGTPHARARDFIGDYVAQATRDFALWYRDENGESKDFLACHAGLCGDETTVPLIIIER
ncbi:MAG: alkaline phosphatase family protein [Clostridiales bacterium]|nr:alkaline phosphatase family protein [Clostridiales bacterium]